MPHLASSSRADARAATRDRILGAVGQVMAGVGIDGLSVTKVAAAAGLTRTVIYNYFPDRASLLLAFTEHEIGRFLRRYRAEVAAATTSAERVALYVRLQLADYVDHPQPAASEVAAQLSPEAYERLRAHVQPLGRLLAEVIAEGVAAGEFADCDPAATAALIHACLGAERVPLARRQHDLESTIATVTTFVLRALGASPVSP